MASRFLHRWRGVLLSLIGIVAVIWLAFTGQLGLYIHPRYFIFTVIMAVIAGVFVLLTFLLPSQAGSGQHETPPRGAWVWVWVPANIVLIAVTAAGMLALPPTTLTTATVSQRDINGSATSSVQSDAITLVGGDDSVLTVKDWAGLLRKGADETSLAGKSPTLVGFVTPDPDDPTNVFYVARFIITCCAVDAQPVGVPVYLPDWQDQFTIDEWVSVTGAFVSNPSSSSLQAIVLSPSDISSTDRPAQPYVY